MRVRPKVMTVTTTIIALLPLMWSQGQGADVMKRIAAPMVGGLLTSVILTLIVIPVIYSLWQEKRTVFAKEISKNSGRVLKRPVKAKKKKERE